MKSAAIATALLLHAAAIGTVVHLHSGQDATRSSTLPVTINLASNAGASVAVAAAAETPDAAPKFATSIQSPRIKHVDRRQSVSDTAVDTHTPVQPSPALSDESSSAATSGSPSAATIVKTGATIPASYADSNRKPIYPLLSRRQEEQGTVLLRIMVKTDGTAGEIHVKKTSGYPLLDESALHAVQNWRFTPASANNIPIAEWYQIAIPFKLHN